MLHYKFFDQTNKLSQHENAHALLSAVLQEEYGIDYSSCQIAFGENGKPYLKDFPQIHYNLSHTIGCCACLVGNSPCGVDVEKIRKFPDRVAKKICTKRELDFLEKSNSPDRDFFKLWTLKEAWAKATGKGLSIGLWGIEFSISEDNKITSNIDSYSFEQIQVGEFIISSCFLI